MKQWSILGYWHVIGLWALILSQIHTTGNCVDSKKSKHLPCWQCLLLLSLLTWVSTCCSKATLRIIWLGHCSKSQENLLMLFHLSHSPLFYSVRGHFGRKSFSKWVFLCPYNAMQLEVWVSGNRGWSPTSSLSFGSYCQLIQAHITTYLLHIKAHLEISMV